jgi:L-threonylcarbamoyladenylate synthase
MLKADVSTAINALKKGKIIVYPTDTLYGLGADIFNETALRKVFEIKKRPKNLPLSIAVSNFHDTNKFAYINHSAKMLIEKFLPGKLTLIVKKKPIISDLITAGLKKVAIRIPDNVIALELLSRFGPLTATSANIHGKKTHYIISDIAMQLKSADIIYYLDDGALSGQPSTIVDVSNKKIKIIREGAIKLNDIQDAVKNG